MLSLLVIQPLTLCRTLCMHQDYLASLHSPQEKQKEEISELEREGAARGEETGETKVSGACTGTS